MYYPGIPTMVYTLHTLGIPYLTPGSAVLHHGYMQDVGVAVRRPWALFLRYLES